MATTFNSFLYGSQFPHSRAALPFSSSSSSFRRSRPYLLLTLAQDVTPPPTPPPIETTTIQQQQQLMNTASPFSQSLLVAPKPQSQSPTSDLPDGSPQWISMVLQRVAQCRQEGQGGARRFSKDGSALQLTAGDGHHATVVIPNDPDLIDILAMNSVDISVSEGESGNSLLNFIGNLLFLLFAFGGLFLLFHWAQGDPGGLGGPMDFCRSKSKFQEVPETGVTFTGGERGSESESGSGNREGSGGIWARTSIAV